MKEIRVYGADWLGYKDKNTELHVMDLKKGARSSVHHHDDLINTFICLAGRIQIDTYKKEPNEDELDYSIIINPYEKTKVSQGRWHSFLALEDTLLLEVYSQIDTIDITRRDIGNLENLT